MAVSLRCEQARLGNGLRVHVHEDHTFPLVAVNLWYHVGSRNERPGRTGFAHLFEHLMFEGSAHVPPGRFDVLLESVGGISNGSTSTDRTNYWETVPSHALETPLFLESDRMAALAPAVTQEKLDAQRDVVKNERRQSCENRPYGLVWEVLRRMLHPEGHPYRWPVIGSMADLDAATIDDVLAFFRTWYAPNNATLAIAGDVRADRAIALADRWFGAIPAGPPVPPIRIDAQPPDGTMRGVLEDTVQLPRIYLAWPTPPTFAPGDAELDLAAYVLAHGRASRLHRVLVHDREIAQDVDALQRSAQLGSVFCVVATARPGVSLPVLESALRDEIAMLPDRLREADVDRARRVLLLAFFDALQTVGGFGGKADRLNFYAFYTGDPNHAERDVARFETASAASIAETLRLHVARTEPVVLGVVPRGRSDLAPEHAVEMNGA